MIYTLHYRIHAQAATTARDAAVKDKEVLARELALAKKEVKAAAQKVSSETPSPKPSTLNPGPPLKRLRL